MYVTTALRTALAAATEDQIVFDLAGIAERHATLLRELPGLSVRFAMKACPVDEVLCTLAQQGAGFDAASPAEIAQAISAGAPIDTIHFGNTIKSDQHIADAYRLGVRDFATDSMEDVRAIARHAPGARVFCRLATDGEGALWGLSRKFGCTPSDAVRIMAAARAAGLTPAGLSFHVGSQQMTAEAWRSAIDRLAGVLTALGRRGIRLDHINLGGGLPALGCLDRYGRRLNPPLDKIFAVIREGMQQLRAIAGTPLDFLMEPGRHLVADHGAIRAHVARLSAREQLGGERAHWLYLSCGKFNGLYEMDGLQYPLVFPTHSGAHYIPAVIAGPTCDSDDAYGPGLVLVPEAAASGDPVWIMSCGAYATSYTTQGFNGFSPLPYTWIDGDRTGRGGAPLTAQPAAQPPAPAPAPAQPPAQQLDAAAIAGGLA
ncbi:type III PLP-dependent enzyme [Streptomyces zagrosensis]|uniref:ornithine decarboxylase n=1 Tax=Streptomyces zagrosensis TaxID=1042984 RepID=A0A7W9V2K9_9ACTN|nr:type III PLP-dependent enzyme [Streptomyces zagrosensis]MBB5940067.1 ornithine decarboxylase [Streptomyces zagrosensis]